MGTGELSSVRRWGSAQVKERQGEPVLIERGSSLTAKEDGERGKNLCDSVLPSPEDSFSLRKDCLRQATKKKKKKKAASRR